MADISLGILWASREEVPVVLGVLVTVFVIFIAWLSTHTTELPFFSVIVVELSARAARLATGHENATPAAEESSEGESASSEDSTQEDALDVEQVGVREENVSKTAEPVQQSGVVCGGERPTKDSASSADSAGGGATSGDVATPCTSSDTSSALSDSGSKEVTAGIGLESDSRETTGVTQGQTASSEDDQNAVSKASGEGLILGDGPAGESFLGSLGVDGEIGQGPDDSELVRLRTNSNEVRRRRLEFLKFRTSSNFPQSSSAASSSQPQVSTVAGDQSGIRDSMYPKLGSSSSEGGVDQSVTLSRNSSSEPSLNQRQDGTEEVSDDVNSGLIRIRLKFLNDTNRLVHASPMDTIGHFRREHFAEELAENKLVRFIFNGRALQNDAHTLQACNIQDNSVLHCLVTRGPTAEAGVPQRGVVEEEVQLGSFVYWLFALVLGLLWYARVSYRHYFNPASTLMLGAITFLFLLAYAASFRNQHRHQHLE